MGLWGRDADSPGRIDRLALWVLVGLMGLVEVRGCGLGTTTMRPELGMVVAHGKAQGGP